MEDVPNGDFAGACPHVDRNDPRCGTRFSLGRIDQAFCVCFGSYRACPMYYRINHELAVVERETAEPPLITVTAHGLPVPLRATGT